MFTKAFLLDLLERALSTLAQAFLGAYVLVGPQKAIAAAGIAAGLAVLKALAATRFGAPDSASLLPADVDPPGADGEAGHGDLAGLVTAAFALIVLLVILRAFHLI